MTSAVRLWWRQPAGGQEVLKLALPMVISSLSWTVMTFVDRIFLKWVSDDAMAAAFSSSAVWFVLLCLPLGVCAYANTFVSQYFGDKQFRQIGPAVWQAIWVALILSPIILLANPLAPMIFAAAGHTPGIQAEEVRYFQSLNWGAGGMLISQAAAAFYSGRGKTEVIMLVDSFFALLNVFLDYVWIFGLMGFPEDGIAGAGYATSVALWLKALTYVLLILQSNHRQRFGTGLFWLDWQKWTRLWYYGGPSGLQMVLDVVGFTTFVVLVGRLGGTESAATSMAFSISTLAFMPIWGFGMASGILVGQHLGENNPELAARATWNSLAIGMGYMAVISIMYVVVPKWFLFWFFAGGEQLSGGIDGEVGTLATTLLQFVAAYNLFDALLTILANAVKGAGDTLFVLLVSLIMGLALAILSWLAVEVWNSGIYQCWVIIVGWVWILGLIYLARFMQGKWKKMRVIEMSS